ncbi:MAG: hypothetical protein SGPRY_007390, partial [Prymnesium sp.]
LLQPPEFLIWERWFHAVACGKGLYVEIGTTGEVLKQASSAARFYQASLGWQSLLLLPDAADLPSLKQQLPSTHLYTGTLCARSQDNWTLAQVRKRGGSSTAQLVHPKSHKATRQTASACHWLPALLSLHHLHCIDYLNLNLEGSEADMVAAVPWDRLTVRIVQLRMHFGKEGPTQHEAAISMSEQMRRHQYRFAGNISAEPSEEMMGFIFESRERRAQCHLLQQ